MVLHFLEVEKLKGSSFAINIVKNYKTMRFTLAYTEGNEVDRPEIPKGFNTIQEVKEWCDENKISYYIVRITEWDNLEQHENYHGIVAQCNFDEVAEENWQDELAPVFRNEKRKL